MSVDFRFRLGFYTSSCGLPLYVCSSLLFFVLFAAVPACFDMDPSVIYTHIGFYVLSHNKKYYFFYDFYVFASFFVSIKAHFMSTVCGFYAESLPLNFTWEGRKNKETLFCNLIYCLLFNFNRTNATFRQFAEPKPNKCFYQNIQSLKQIFDTQSSHLQDENKQNNKPGLYFASI